MRPGHFEMLADVIDIAHFGRVGVDPLLAVLDHRVIVPGALPQLVKHIQIFVGDLIAVVMHHLCGMPEIARCIGQIRGHDVPAHPAFGQVIEGAHASRKGKWRLVGGGKGSAKPEVFGDRRHGRNHHQRIIAGDLHGLAQRGLRAIAKLIVGANHIRQKHPVEGAVLQQLSQFGPVVQIVEAVPVVLGMHPQPVDDMAHTVHFKQIDVQLLGHQSYSYGAGLGVR